MKKLAILLTLNFLLILNTQAQYQRIEDTTTGKEILVGTVKIDQLEEEDGFENLMLSSDFDGNEAQLQTIKEKLQGVKILAFIGTWCEDSQIYFPELVSLFRNAEFDFSNMEIFALDRTKKNATGQTEHWKIENVPTLIFIKDGSEIGRFVEYPQKSVKDDIIKILDK